MLRLLAPSPPPHATVIFLHGLGQTNSSWMPWVQELAKHFPRIDWILPQADIGPVTFPDGSSRPRWFDVHALPPGEDEDDNEGAVSSRNRVQKIIQEVIDSGMPSQKVFLVGFSQGSAIALLSGLTFPHVLGGIAVLSGWLPAKLRSQLVFGSVVHPSLFWAHGTADDDIPLQNGLEKVHWLRDSLGFENHSLEFHEYHGMGHHVNDQVLLDLRDWLTTLLTP